MEKPDFADCRRHAHSLKGACGYVASVKLKATALRMQLACEAVTAGTGDAKEAQACFDDLQRELTQVVALIEDHLKTLES